MKDFKKALQKRLKGNPKIGYIFSLFGSADIDFIMGEVERVEREYQPHVPVDIPPVFSVFGDIGQDAITDMQAVLRHPSMVGGALLPDAHRTSPNSVPVGGVVASDGYLFPQIVGSDISCSVMATKFRASVGDYSIPELTDILVNNTRFNYDTFPTNSFVDDFLTDLSMLQLKTSGARQLWEAMKPVILRQLGSSGDGNHFANIMKSESGDLCLVTHWGSRNIGARVCKHFTAEAKKLAKNRFFQKNPAIEADSDLGRDYLTLLYVCGMFAAQGHNLVHLLIENALQAEVAAKYFSRHNYLWEENGLYVHRKGATPAAKGVVGVIPMNMVAPVYIVEGEGSPFSYNSASHGAGRVMSRSEAKKSLGSAADYAKSNGVVLIGGDADEHPLAYKDPETVMEAQKSCASVLEVWNPVVVRMAEPMEKRWKR